jgi:hypothetical protein
MLPILEEAGGKIHTWSGEPTIWGKDAAATNAALNVLRPPLKPKEKHEKAGQWEDDNK